MTAIEEMAGMDILCSDKTGTLTLNKLTVDKTLIEVFVKDMDKDTVVLMGARASRVENQDAIDACIVGMLGNPKEVINYYIIQKLINIVNDNVLPNRVMVLLMQARAGVTEVHFLPFNPVDKRTAMTYIDQSGNWHRVSKGAPEQVYIINN